MKTKHTLRLSFLAILVVLLLQSCEDKSSFGEDLQLLIVPTDISYPDIINAREFSYIESAVPFMSANGHPVHLELVNIKKDGEILDPSYMNSVTMLGFTTIETEHPDTGDIILTKDLSENGKIVIADGNPFSNGDYYFTIKASVVVGSDWDSAIFEDVFHLNVGPGLAEGIAYCPFKMNFVSGENTTSNPVELFGANPDVRYELGSESEKLTIDPVTGAISLNPSYAVSETEYLNPIITVVSNISEEVVSFEEKFTAVISATPIVLEKENDYFFFPNLIPVTKDNLNFGGDGWSRQVVESHSDDDGWYNPKALWRAKTPPVNTPDALAVQADSGVKWTQRLEIPFWTVAKPHDSWVIMDSQNLALYEGCFDSKAVFWYALYMKEVQSGYEADGSAPIGLEVHITNNFTGDVTTTDWTQVNDILECEINNNGTVFTGTPYPGDQTGLNPDGLKDPAKNANKLWVRCELNLEDYKTQNSFTIAFRCKTYYDKKPYHLDTNGNPAVNGWVRLSNVHFVASEK
jgi:hypothetical protein